LSGAETDALMEPGKYAEGLDLLEGSDPAGLPRRLPDDVAPVCGRIRRGARPAASRHRSRGSGGFQAVVAQAVVFVRQTIFARNQDPGEILNSDDTAIPQAQAHDGERLPAPSNTAGREA
jgi:hypothetical protein